MHIKLEQAQRLIEQVRDTLNNQIRKCECCGLTVYESQQEWTQRQMLNAAIQRVQRVAEQMRRDDGQGDVSGV